MRLPLLTMIILVIINLALDAFIYFRLKKNFKSRFPAFLQLITSIMLFALAIVIAALPKRSIDNNGLISIMWMLYIYFSLYVPKYIYATFYAIASIPVLFKRNSIKLIKYTGVLLGFVAFVAMWWGALIGRNDIEVKSVDLVFPSLPTIFNGYRIVQISDLHLGTYGTDTTFVSNVVNEINSLKPDLIVFSGDIVNRQTDEMLPFKSVLNRLKARNGVISVLGNHDYGDYRDWNTQESKDQNMLDMISLQRELGWRLMNNSSIKLKKGNDSIVIIGVENWGDPPFKMYADLQKAYSKLDDDAFKVLISHNPAHWRSQVIPETNIALTLSGHTHAMQVSANIFGESYSPAYWRYKEWGGVYDEKGQKLYVNVGLGEVAIPMRLGATPEITLITLENAK